MRRRQKHSLTLTARLFISDTPLKRRANRANARPASFSPRSFRSLYLRHWKLPLRVAVLLSEFAAETHRNAYQS